MSVEGVPVQMVRHEVNMASRLPEKSLITRKPIQMRSRRDKKVKMSGELELVNGLPKHMRIKKGSLRTSF
jgi:hypothetical protein